MSRPSLIAITLMLCLLAAPAGAAETIYKWTDEQGTVHYGERPPEGVDAERVLVTSLSGKSAAGSRDPYASATEPSDAEDTPSAAEQQREERAERIRQREAEEARIAAACVAQKDRLEQLVPRSKVILQNPDGTSRMLDDDERLAMIEESQSFVDQNCDD